MKSLRYACLAFLILGSVGSAHAAVDTSSFLCRWIPFFCAPPRGTQPPPTAASVPEIDASSGTKAIALLAGVVVLTAEIRRRKA